jgi:hypothetical protein
VIPTVILLLVCASSCVRKRRTAKAAAYASPDGKHTSSADGGRPSPPPPPPATPLTTPGRRSPRRPPGSRSSQQAKANAALPPLRGARGGAGAAGAAAGALVPVPGASDRRLGELQLTPAQPWRRTSRSPHSASRSAMLADMPPPVTYVAKPTSPLGSPVPVRQVQAPPPGRQSQALLRITQQQAQESEHRRSQQLALDRTRAAAAPRGSPSTPPRKRTGL